MKILAINGSPRGSGGNTGHLLDAMVTAMRAGGAEVDVMLLAQTPVQPCRACDVCHTSGGCPVDDAFNAVKASMDSADAIVLASPNYIFSVTAQLKALLDRCCGPLHIQSLRDKYAAAVVTSGGAGSAEVEGYLLRFLRTMGCWTVGSVGFEASRVASPEASAGCFQAAAELGERLVEAIDRRKVFPEQAAERSAFYDRMKALVLAHKTDWPFEYEYWSSHGRL